MITRYFIITLCLLLGATTALANSDVNTFTPKFTEIRKSHLAKIIKTRDEYFKPGPDYSTQDYDAKNETAVYAQKPATANPRPPIEIGRKLYYLGELPTTGVGHELGRLNPTKQQFFMYGDWRTVYSYNHNEKSIDNNLIITTFNLEFDYILTATERFHFALSPLEKNLEFTRWDFEGKDRGLKGELDLRPDTFFFEGDLGNITAGFSNRYKRYDLPFAIGLIPMFTQNGIWIDDKFWGLAFTLPAKNSQRFSISNFDVTFFAGLADLTSPAFVNADGDLMKRDGRVIGVTSFIEANTGYWEVGFAKLFSKTDDFGYYDATVAFSRRYGRISNSIRLIGAFGQRPPNSRFKTAKGIVILVENSWVSRQPLILVPYFNLFAGFGRPQAVANTNGTGVLKNTGITFETDGQTGFPRLDDTAADTYGGAIGIEYLFDLNRQIVAEVGFVGTHGADVSGEFGARPAAGEQVAVGLRYQHAFTPSWIFRVDGIYGIQWDDIKNTHSNISGIRTELRLKF